MRLVIVLGSQQQIDAHLRDHGREPQFVGGYRITDQAALRGAIEASGCSRMEVRGACPPLMHVCLVQPLSFTRTWHAAHALAASRCTLCHGVAALQS